MALLNDTERTRVQAAIRAAEAGTAGEFVVVVAPRAAHYLEFVLLYALVAGALTALSEPLWGGWGLPSALLAATLVELTVVVVLLAAPRLRVNLVPGAVRESRCRALARAQFSLHDVARTRDRSGVLLFVAADEHYIEVIADEGIHAAVPAATWAGLVDGFIAKVRAGELGAGFESAIGAIGAVLAAHLPRRADDRNELADRLIEL